MFRWLVPRYSLSSCLPDRSVLASPTPFSFLTPTPVADRTYLLVLPKAIYIPWTTPGYSALILFFGLHSLYLGIVWYRGVSTALLRVHQSNL
jgi:hypothetical protein